jgi:hypothetical protein
MSTKKQKNEQRRNELLVDLEHMQNASKKLPQKFIHVLDKTLTCVVELCQLSVFSRNLCRKHYNKMRYHGLIEPAKKHEGCAVKDCPGQYWGRNLCKAHYMTHYRSDYTKYAAEQNRRAKTHYHERKNDPEFAERMRKKSRLRHKLQYDLILKYRQSPKGRFKAGINMAKERGLVWEISFEEFSKLVQKKCHYCTTDLNVPGSLQGVGLDRMDSKKGYLLDNVVTCCGFCNKLKNNLLTTDETLQVVALLKKIRNKENVWEGGVVYARTRKN